MEKKVYLWLIAGLLFLALAGCSQTQGEQPTSTPTGSGVSTSIVTATATDASPTAIPPTNTPVLPTLTPWPTLPGPTPTVVGTTPGVPSGPYGVILVVSSDLLYIKNGPGDDYDTVGAFLSNTNNIMRTGPSKVVAGVSWVEVEKPGGGTGWVNSYYLTQYIFPPTFCDSRKVRELLDSFDIAIKASDGWTLSTIISPTHGLSVRLWRDSPPIVYSAQQAKLLFVSPDVQNWGTDPLNGQPAVGSFNALVLPKLLDVANADYRGVCDSAADAGPTPEPWPSEYANINFYTIHKPGPPGTDTDWRTWLIGIEYVENVRYLFALIHFEWVP